jgi:hypothetical protein
MSSLINLSIIRDIPREYPVIFLDFCKKNSLHPPSIHSGNGIALAMMLHYPEYYWSREVCNEFVDKFNIPTNDCIQLFNKHEQWGLQTSNVRGKYFIPIPYSLSKKHKMRKDFKFDGTEEQKQNEINKIKSTIMHDYIDSHNSTWQLGHKNPESEDNTNDNLVLQPPIQAKYRDKYIFLDTLTKIPTPKTLIQLYQQGECPYTEDQLNELKTWLDSL